VQRAMMRATERAGSLKDPVRVRPWFGRILRRGIADFYRSRRPEGTPDSADMDVAADTLDAAGNPCACSLRLLEALRPSYAEVLRRIDVEGQSAESVAMALAISAANLHVRLHRARRALRERVKRHCGVSTSGPCLDCTCGARGRCGGAVSR
jgi:DNA-directed RNA polymerase specialized sigma24 family protein